MEDRALTGSVYAEFKGGSVRFDYDLGRFGGSSLQYDHELARFACLLSLAGYDRVAAAGEDGGVRYEQEGLTAVLDEMGFTRRELCPAAARDEQSYFFAARTMTLNGEACELVLAAFIGSYQKMWYSDFDPLGAERVCRDGAGYAGNDEAGRIHLGFADARDFAYERLRAFLLKNNAGLPIRLLLTGHSRGAAAAGLLAAKVLAGGGLGEGLPIAPEHVFAYCFATPNYADARLTDLTDPRYRQIYNVVSPEDFVTEVFPKASGFGKYGAVFSIFGPDNRSREDYAREKAVMTRFFLDYRAARPYVPYKDGNRSVEKIVAVMAKSMPDMDAFYHKKMRLCFKSCTPFEFFRDTLCAFVGGSGSPEDRAAYERAKKLLVLGAEDRLGTSPPLRRLCAFFVFKQGLAGVTGGRVGAEYFNDAHIAETYLAYMMSMREAQLVRVQECAG